jgi:hypothetical protein
VYKSSTTPIQSTEAVILPVEGFQRFAWEGDSGALVYDTDEQRKFMVWGRPHPEYSSGPVIDHMVFITPLGAIHHDLQARLASCAGRDVEITIL